MTRSNIVLIGMPGAGKSTVGVVLARCLGLGFLDTDLLLQQRSGRRLQEIVDREGLVAFRRREEEILLGLRETGTVIATGGSAVYSEMAMQSLTKIGIVVFLDLPLEELRPRLRDMATRGLVIDPGETLEELYRRRLPLYRRHAEIVIDGRGKSIEETAAEIAARPEILRFFGREARQD